MNFAFKHAVCFFIIYISFQPAFATHFKFNQSGDTIEIVNSGQTLQISTKAPQFIFEKNATPENIRYTAIEGQLNTGQIVQLTYPLIKVSDQISLEVKLLLQFSKSESLLRKWAKFRVTAAPETMLLKQIILEKINTADRIIEMHQGWLQSYPAFTDGFFIGLEFPVANNTIKNDILTISHNPGIDLKSGIWYESKKAVFGIAEPGKQKQKFKQYINAHRPLPHKLHFNYNSWWTAPSPFTEKDILDLMNTFKTQLYDRTGVSFDTFCLDMGWSQRKSIWQISKERFPDEFNNIRKVSAQMEANLGLWVSPSSHYNGGLDNKWAEDNGYEVIHVHHKGRDYLRCCLAGENYQAAFTNNLADIVKRFGVRHIKFDGISLICNDKNHGHYPEYLSYEKIAQGMISVFRGIRKQAPDIWFETTCMGWDPSPWWLFYVNSVIGTYGTDAPQGRVPCPVYRESYTSARDYFNLQGAAMLNIPIAAQEVLGIIHQTEEPFLNDALTTIMRGHSFLPLYINPKYMNTVRWSQLGDILKWARKNSDILQQTQPLLPNAWESNLLPKFSNDAQMPRQPYGYAHWKNDEGLILLRNPWIVPQHYYISLDKNTTLSKKIKKLSVVSLYPQVRLYAKDIKFNDCLDIPLAPYETVVLRISKNNKLKNIPPAKNCIGGKLQISVNYQQIKKIIFEEKPTDPNDDYAKLLLENDSAYQLKLKADVLVKSPKAKLLILSEGDEKATPVVDIKINGQPAVAQIKNSNYWYETHLEYVEFWTFVEVDLQKGKSKIDIKALLSGKSTNISVWLWAIDNSENTFKYDGRLPAPELLSLDSAVLLKPTDTSQILETGKL